MRKHIHNLRQHRTCGPIVLAMVVLMLLAVIALWPLALMALALAVFGCMTLAVLAGDGLPAANGQMPASPELPKFLRPLPRRRGVSRRNPLSHERTSDAKHHSNH